MNAYGNTPLHLACYNGQDVVVSELIETGANVNQVCACLTVRERTSVIIVFVLNCVILYFPSGEREGLLCSPLRLLLTPGGAVPGDAVGPRSSHQHAGVSMCRYTFAQTLKHTNSAVKLSICLIWIQLEKRTHFSIILKRQWPQLSPVSKHRAAS